MRYRPRVQARMYLQGGVSLSGVPHFTSIDQQIANLRTWLDLEVAAPRMQTVSRAKSSTRPLEAVTLCWTLTTAQATFDEKVRIMRLVFAGFNVYVSPALRKISVDEFEPDRIWWQTVDLGASVDLSPMELAPMLRADTQVLDVACQHPEYVMAQNGKSIPYVAMAGIRSGLSPEPHCPFGFRACLAGGGESGPVSLDVISASDDSRRYAVAEITRFWEPAQAKQWYN